MPNDRVILCERKITKFKEYLEIKNLLQEDHILKEELKEIWKSFKSQKNPFNLESVSSFITELVDFSRMICKLAELPKHEISIRFTNFISFVNPFKKYYDQGEEND